MKKLIQTSRMIQLALLLLFSFSSLWALDHDDDKLLQQLDFEVADKSGKLPAGWMFYGLSEQASASLDQQAYTSGSNSLHFVSNSEEKDKPMYAWIDVPNFRACDAIKVRFDFLVQELAEECKVKVYGVTICKDGKFLLSEDMFIRTVDSLDWGSGEFIMPLTEDDLLFRLVFLLEGAGKAWVDNFIIQGSVDGVDQAWTELPIREKYIYAADSDTEFDQGSKLVLDDLTEPEYTYLEIVGQVWAFLKYRHPAIARGKVNWDAELFRKVPAVLEANSLVELNSVLENWIIELNVLSGDEIVPTKENEEADVYLRSDLSLLERRTWFSDHLIQMLKQVHLNRSNQSDAYYVGLNSVMGARPKHEKVYDETNYPDDGYRLLAIYRLWAMVQNLNPYRTLTEEDWNDVLRESIIDIVRSSNATEYFKAMQRAVAKIDDSHSNYVLDDWDDANGVFGEFWLNLKLKYLNGQYVVVDLKDAKIDHQNPFEKGDVIMNIDGVDAHDFEATMWSYAVGSNDAVKRRHICGLLVRSNEPTGTAQILRGDTRIELSFSRLRLKEVDWQSGYYAWLKSQPEYWSLENNILFLNVLRLKRSTIAEHFDTFREAKGLVIDLRIYPSDPFQRELGSFLNGNEKPFSRFTGFDPTTPGQFVMGEPYFFGIENDQPYEGKIAILVDEGTQGHAEFCAMAYQLSPQAKVFGSQTAAADGNAEGLKLPGGNLVRFTSIGVYYPDKTETQQIGIVPDVEVRPTAEGIREGRDEVLEVALEFLREKQ